MIILEFSNLEELYNRIKPALETKKREMKRNGYSYIKVEDIWNYLKEVKWLKSTNLALFQMVDDIMNLDIILVDKYLKDKFNTKNRKVYFDV